MSHVVLLIHFNIPLGLGPPHSDATNFGNATYRCVFSWMKTILKIVRMEG
jgi:hypothetical protein